jgi:hypothetical protein
MDVVENTTVATRTLLDTRTAQLMSQRAELMRLGKPTSGIDRQLRQLTIIGKAMPFWKPKDRALVRMYLRLKPA